MSYRKRVARDLDRWIEDGLVAKENRDAILARLSSARPAWSPAGAAAILGAVLLALAALSFVAANWAGLDRIWRFALILAALWAAFAGSAFAFARKAPAPGHALALLGTALFGAAIILTAQTFNMSAFRNTGVLIWTIGALGTALIVPSRPVLIFAALLGAGWVWLESFNPFAPDIVWGYLPLWAVTATAASVLASRASWNLLSAGLLIWIAFILYDAGERELFSVLEMSTLLALFAGALAMIAASLNARGVFGTGVLAHWTATASLVAAFIVQFPVENLVRDRSGLWLDVEERWAGLFGLEGGAFLVPGAIAAGIVIALAGIRHAQGRLPGAAALCLSVAAATALALPYLARWAGEDFIFALRLALGAAVFALAAGLILLGAREGRRFIGGLGVALFIAQSLYVYANLFGDLLDTAAFFFVGGIVFLSLSFVVARLHGQLRPARIEGETS